MLVWFAVQTLPLPDPTRFLDYGPLGLMGLVAILAAALIWKLAPQALKAWTEMNTCAAKQATVLERTTAAVEEHRSQSGRQHEVTTEAMRETSHILKRVHESMKELSNEIKRRNGH